MSAYESLADLAHWAMAHTGKEQHMKLQVSKEVLEKFSEEWRPIARYAKDEKDDQATVVKYVFAAGEIEIEEKK